MSTERSHDSSRDATDSSDAVDAGRVRERLDRVTDPELDRSIVELDYVDEIRVDGGHVTVRFTLPTAWCSPAFAWMMAVDARNEVESFELVHRRTRSARVNMSGQGGVCDALNEARRSKLGRGDD